MMEDIHDELRSYQNEALKIMRPRKRNLEYDDMGLGKTLTVLVHMQDTHNSEDMFNFLIVCGKKSLYVWQSQIEQWLNKKSIIYHGTPAKRKKIWQEFLVSYDVNFLITTYGMLQEIADNTQSFSSSGRFLTMKETIGSCWNYIAADEIHENGLLNHKAKTYEIFEKFARNIDFVTLITGTPIRQGVIDCYAPLHIMDRYKFNNYWQFVARYCNTLQNTFGKSIERNPKDPVAFRQLLNNYMIRRTKQELIDRGDLKDLPGKQRQAVEIDMNEVQQRVFNSLIEEMFYVEGDNVIIAPNHLVTDMRIRQLLVCPRILGIDNNGEGLDYILSEGTGLLDNNQPFVIFTPFKQAIPHIEEAVKKTMNPVRIYKIHGDMKPEDFAKQWKGFQSNPDKRKVLLCVIKSSSSFDAYAASYGFFLGYEEDFNLNVQAEDRLCRLGQHNFVNIYYIVNRGTVDENIRWRLNSKQEASDWIIGNEEKFQSLLKRYKVVHQIGTLKSHIPR
jgi:SNF2 family DNA or RNA helicase